MEFVFHGRFPLQAVFMIAPSIRTPELMRELHGRRYAVDQNDLVAPVELVGFAWRVIERHIGTAATAPRFFAQILA